MSNNINNFLNSQRIDTYNLIETFINLLGFVPVYRQGTFPSGVYCGAEFNSVADFYAKRKPVIYGWLLGVELPLAYINSMPVIANLCVDMECSISSITLDHFPDIVKQYIDNALNKLRTNEPHRVEDVFVYDYLGLLDNISISQKFVYCDELVDLNDSNIIACGYHREDTQLIKISINLRSAHAFKFDDKLLNDNILRLLAPYQKVKIIYDKSFTKLDVLSLQLYLRDRNHKV
jgi:hypothetical protein